MTILKTKNKKNSVVKSDLDSLKKALYDAKIDYYDFNIVTGADYHTDEIAKQLGYTSSDVDTFEKRINHIHPDDVEATLNHIEKLINGEVSSLNIEYRVISKHRKYIWIKHIGSINVNKETKEEHFIGIIRDITKEKENLSILDYSLMYDDLTKAYSRKYGLDRLEELFSKNHKFAIAYLDINNMKQINDTYGHKNGDEILVKFVSSLQSKIRNSDYVIRIGGDEFLMVFENMEEDELVKKISTLKVEGINYSYGICDTTEELLSVNDLIELADSRMYLNKKSAEREE